MVGVEWNFQQFKFGSCSTFVITNEFLEKVRVRKLVKLNLKIILRLLCTGELKSSLWETNGILRFRNKICVRE